MSSCNNTLLDLEDHQVCYLQCGFCTTILLVSVPITVTTTREVNVICGQCNSLLSVNMFEASFFPPQHFASLSDELQQVICSNEVEVLSNYPTLKVSNMNNPVNFNSDIFEEEITHPQLIAKNPANLYSDYEEENIPPRPIVNKPPERKRRVPSAYNRFIKEEIRRLKVIDPNMTHKIAFGTAAKNWSVHARFQQKIDGEGYIGRNTAAGERNSTVTTISDALASEHNNVTISNIKKNKFTYWIKTRDFHLQGKLKNIIGIPTSKKTKQQALSLGIPLSDLDSHPVLDLAIDGADEVDGSLNLVKGRGGSLLREKMVESVCKQFVVIVDESKIVHHLGSTGGSIPIEVIPFCWKFIEMRLQNLFKDLGCAVKLRTIGEGQNEEPFVIDNANYIVNLYFKGDIGGLNVASDAILRLPGVVEHGMFLNIATTAIVAGELGVMVRNK
ncbi:hypothetical protein GIB67_017684 [Kingdonia uniflora]|uniref:ribose-5-phosphate isomerase n=1 Tax=Kingdonia uniflora TaxID=39325 RepID=A0A7J7NAQ4_9MAGN|nr:hypothetical protein GIB67_017684 [Kingdonia uniflora]